MRNLNVIACGASSRLAAQVGAARALRREHNIQRVFSVSAGAVSGSLLAAGVQQSTLEDAIRQLDMDRLVRGAKRTFATVMREGGRFSLDDAVAELREQLARHGMEGRGVRTFGDLAPLDPDYAADLERADAWRLSVRVWTLPSGVGHGLWLLPTLVRLGWADRRFGEARRNSGAGLGGVFKKMRTLELPNDIVRARMSEGESLDDAMKFVGRLAVADIAALTMALPGTFPPGSFRPALPERTFDGAMLERVPARRYPTPYSEQACPGVNDLCRLADGRPDPTPLVALAMSQPNGFTATEQAAWDRHHKTIRHGIFVVRLPHLGVGLTDFDAGRRRARELIDAADEATTAAITGEAYERYLDSRRRSC